MKSIGVVEVPHSFIPKQSYGYETLAPPRLGTEGEHCRCN